VTVTILEPPWEVDTPKGKAYAHALIDYSQESYIYFLTSAKGTGEFWIYRNDKVRLWWNESTGLGRRPDMEEVSKHGRS
jgi:hypothetical protein